MFASKKREWINDSFAIFTYGSWKEWTYERPYDYLWRTYKPMFWNIRDCDGEYEIQIFFLVPSGKLEFICAKIPVKYTDEKAIQDWMSIRGLA